MEVVDEDQNENGGLGDDMYDDGTTYLGEAFCIIFRFFLYHLRGFTIVEVCQVSISRRIHEQHSEISAILMNTIAQHMHISTQNCWVQF